MPGEHGADLAARSNLTASQLLIWAGQRLQPDDPLYNMVLAFRIRGAVDVAAFRRAFQALVDDCDALRAVVRIVDDVPLQYFEAHCEYELEFLDFATRADAREDLRAWLAQRSVRPFDLDRRLFDSALIRLADDEFVWYLNQHHIMTDAWSVAVLYRAMQARYAHARAQAPGRAAPLPAYADYVRLEREKRDSPALRKAGEYWRARLGTPLRPSNFYRRSPAQREGRTRRVPCRIGAQRTAALKALAGEGRFRAFTEELSLFQMFATLLFAYLHRIGGHDELAIGTPSHSRGSAEHKDTAGLFIEIFPLQVALDAGESFESLFAKVARAAHELLLHAQPGASGFEHHRAYDVVLNYITAAFGDFDGLAVESEWLHPGYGDRNHLLRLQVYDFDRADALVLNFDLNEDVFRGEDRDAVVRHFLRLLDAFIDDASQPLAGVALLDRDERDAMVHARNRTAVARLPVTVLDLFAQQAAATPAAVALACEGESRSYAELDRDSNRLAQVLRARGVEAGGRVGIAMSRSPDALVAILGVLKCGAAYVPIDPDYPDERVDLLLADAGVALVLTQSRLQSRFEQSLRAAAVPLLAVDGARAEIAAAAPEAPAPAPARDAVAYVIYTSGSTGRPKGVAVSHANLAHYLQWARDYYLQGEALAFAWFSSLAFDLTVTATFVPLIGGGRLVIYPERAGRRELAIHRVIEDDQVDVIKLTPVHLSLIRAMDLDGLRLRRLIVGGEDLKTELARSIVRRTGERVEIYNEYGPTEATVACMIHRFDPGRDTDTSVPIGRPIDNARIYLLDAHQNPVPPGVAGEIFIGGDGVAAGYLDQPEVTAQRFLSDPFVPGARMYRTGDLARWNERGELDYLGREDHQVKIRGVRVELGEIEAALCAVPGIDEAVVEALERHQSGHARAEFCVRCGLSAQHPEAALDAGKVCALCRVYAEEHASAEAYFRDLDALRAIAARARAARPRAGAPDCLMLLSGGKDSTYALCRLVEIGFTPLVFTLDNGYISEGAKANIRRVVDSLGLELVTGNTPDMNAIFVDSLNRHSNVCNGCFKTIYTLSMNLARKRGIRYIVTGLSRGQIFETRLADLFKQREFDPARIDRTIIEARKAYHRMDDAVSRCLDVSAFDDDAVFEEIEFVDFYRYCDVTLDEMLRYLREHAPWIRPADTGRSTNCLINEAGIYVHKRERGFHNYALPYSWDVRLGHKQRDAAREELDDDIDVDNVHRILGEVGYDPRALSEFGARDKRLVAYYVDAQGRDRAPALREQLAARLPAEYVPAHFVRLTALPLTPNHKVDRRALLPPDDARPELSEAYSAPSGQMQRTLAEVWAEVLGLDQVGANDNFFELGGDSILNIQIVARARQHGIALTPQQVFDHPTVSALAAAAGTAPKASGEQGSIEGPVALTPAQHRFFEQALPAPEQYNQALLLEVSPALDAALLERALRHLIDHHDALRARFEQRDGAWHQVLRPPGEARVALYRVDVSALDAAGREARIERLAEELHTGMDLASGRLLAIACLDAGPAEPGLVLLAVHHLVVDAVSLWVMLEDLETACTRLAAAQPVVLPAKTTSVRQWTQALADYAASPRLAAELDYWRQAPASPALPLSGQARGDNDRATAADVAVCLSREDTGRLLHEVPGAFQVQVQEVLVTALARCLTEWTGGSVLRLDLEGHGREALAADLDLMRTVGWFTSVYPLSLALPDGDDPGAALKAVKEQLRAVPQRGMGYGVLRYLGGEAVRGQLGALPAPQVLFNYFGQLDQALSASARLRLARPIMGQFGHRGPRQYLLEVNAAVFEGRLRIDWTFSTARHERATVERLAQACLARVRELIDHCLAAAGRGFTPSDFPQAGLDQTQLDRLLEEFGDSE